ncbi:MAG TPA: RelA/SpoT domain-containing protein [Lacipirellulaceae bacterium]|nr:RelA/SpoT domain-containing protein [Lacipirellulaceae bacterium]
MVPIEVEQWLSSLRAPLADVIRRVTEGVRGLCERNGYAYVGRSKSAVSVAEKLETGRVASLRDIDDLFACSVIVPSLSHEDSVLKALEAMFAPVTIKRRNATFKNPDVFRFEATRFIGRIRVSEIEDHRLGQVSFEVQIRTAFEHAWSVATHGEAYKGDRVDWKLERLAAQMKALVEQLDMLAVDYAESADSIHEHPCDRTQCEVKALDGIRSLCTSFPVPEECTPAKWGLFAKNVIALAEAADWGNRLALEDRVGKIIAAARAEAENQKAAGYPRSLTLFQFVLGAGVQRGVIRTQFRRENYHPPISSALELIFPKTKQISQRCELEINDGDILQESGQFPAPCGGGPAPHP